MLPDRRIKAVLETAPSSPLHRVVTRFVWERFRSTSGSPVGAARFGQRYNEPGTAALYTSLHRETALREFLNGARAQDDLPLGPAVMLSLMVQLTHVLDLTNQVVLRSLGTSIEELSSPRLPGTPHLAARLGTLASANFDGLIVASAIASQSQNLVIFPERHVAPPYLVIRSLP